MKLWILIISFILALSDVHGLDLIPSETSTFPSFLKLDKSILDGDLVKFEKHVGPGAWDNYLSMNLSLPPYFPS